MSSESNENASPFGRPGFIAAAVTVAVIVVLAVVLAIVNASRGDDGPVTPPTSAAPTPTGAGTGTGTPSATQPDAEASVCGLDGVELDGRLTSAPAVDEWQYQGTTAFPVSRTYGPGATDPDDFRYCFQHSPEGALFAAASAIAGSDNPTAWGEYFLSSAVEDRDALLGDDSGAPDSTTRRPRASAAT